MAERVWYIYTNNRGNYTIAKQPTGEFMFTVQGPLTWEEAVSWMKAHGVPGF